MGVQPGTGADSRSRPHHHARAQTGARLNDRGGVNFGRGVMPLGKLRPPGEQLRDEGKGEIGVLGNQRVAIPQRQISLPKDQGRGPRTGQMLSVCGVRKMAHFARLGRREAPQPVDHRIGIANEPGLDMVSELSKRKGRLAHPVY